MDHFDLSVPMSGSWDVRVGARLIAQNEDRITFTIDCADTQEREFWREMLADSEIEADLHKPR